MSKFDKVLTKIFGSSNERFLKTVQPIINQINGLESNIKELSDEELAAKTVEFKERIAKELEGIDDKDKRRAREREVLGEILPEAFAIVREASIRTIGLRHFDVQLIGGLVLHQGKIAEMKTGEGKTLVSTLPAYLNALTGRGVHIVTVNDYLALRDSDWMGRIHRFLGLEVGCIQNDMNDFERKAAYNSDITYGTNNEFGFDYLRDNMKFDLASCCQRDHYFAIVDEVDSILIDEARTPLIISGASDEATDKYYLANEIIPKLVKGEKNDETKETTGDYLVDEKNHTAVLTEAGVSKAEKLLGVGNLYDPNNIELLHCVEQALKAHTLYRNEHHYIVKEGEVIIVDEFTGRLMSGRRWSDGLHQAVEAKEGVKIERENQTLATVTLQNYFRMYEKISGMTGTAKTEEAEFLATYKIDVITIPTNRSMVRKDTPDMIYRTLPEKWKAIAEEVKDKYEVGQPVLVGTVSVESSELISRKLAELKIPHNVLNAKYHEREAEIVAQAGRKGAVTIATNMAGRGTDILLGGNAEFLAKEALKRQEINPDEASEELIESEIEKIKPQVAAEHDEVTAVGGLHIVGTERHESRRIDNQLRGRAGRQGDPGSSRFIISLEDDLMRIFAGDKVRAMMEWLGMEEGVAIESGTVTKRIEGAQKNVEARNFETRKHVLQYDDVMNKQRETIYSLRRQLLETPDNREYIIGETGVAHDLLFDLTEQFLSASARPADWDTEGYAIQLLDTFNFDPATAENIDFESQNSPEIGKEIWERLKAAYKEKEDAVGSEAMRAYERYIMLEIIDSQWKDHLQAIDHLKQGIGLVGYGQKDPVVEYKKESFDMFQAMLDRIDSMTMRALFHLQIVTQQEAEEIEAKRVRQREIAARRNSTAMTFTGANATATVAGDEAVKAKPFKRQQPKIKPNDACFCGSGKKYKKCHGVGV